MNITAPALTTLATPTANIHTEAARRDNILRETIPQSAESDKGQEGQGPGADSDRARQSATVTNGVTYERPHSAEQADSQSKEATQNSGNSQQESAGREQAEQKQKEQAHATEVDALRKRDEEVRTHEEAHRAVGGQYASAPSYEFTTGPDNKRYVTDGEVSIDVSEARTPLETIRKMEQVKNAALAPAQPSAQDIKVASEATQSINRAKSEQALQVAESENNPDKEPLVTRIDRIQFVYHQAYTPKSAGFQTSA